MNKGLEFIYYGVLDAIWTHDLLLRRQSLYPTELRGHRESWMIHFGMHIETTIFNIILFLICLLYLTLFYDLKIHKLVMFLKIYYKDNETIILIKTILILKMYYKISLSNKKYRKIIWKIHFHNTFTISPYISHMV